MASPIIDAIQKYKEKYFTDCEITDIAQPVASVQPECDGWDLDSIKYEALTKKEEMN